MNYRLSPSDLTFLYEGCKRCFVLKVKHGIRQPSIPLPGVFSSISYLQKEYYSDKRTETISPQMPAGVIRYGEQWVRSRIIELPGRSSTCYINGRFDIVAQLDDGSYAVIDFKTGNPSEEKAGFYGRQLHAYAHALENPEKDQLYLSPVSALGLLYFTPDHCEQTGPERQIVGGRLQWLPISRDDAAFMQFLGEAVGLLDGPIPPAGLESCDWCQYLAMKSPVSKTDAISEPERIEPPSCPRCEGPMALRDGKYGKFWSCLRYPECRGTRNAS
jgi:hypothetical protein